jgi:diacylglycerol kinase (ATP)
MRARTVAEREPGFDMVACSGGDGTLDEVVTGMMHCDEKLPIGFVPAGSTNDFAASIHIPAVMSKAADVVVNGRDFACDIGQFNERNFVYIAAFGLFTDVSYETRQDMKNILGHMAYMLEGMRRLSSIDAYHMKLTYDGNTIEDDFMYGMITNSVSVGGFKGDHGK